MGTSHVMEMELFPGDSTVSVGFTVSSLDEGIFTRPSDSRHCVTLIHPNSEKN